MPERRALSLRIGGISNGRGSNDMGILSVPRVHGMGLCSITRQRLRWAASNGHGPIASGTAKYLSGPARLASAAFSTRYLYPARGSVREPMNSVWEPGRPAEASLILARQRRASPPVGTHRPDKPRRAAYFKLTHTFLADTSSAGAAVKLPPAS